MRTTVLALSLLLTACGISLPDDDAEDLHLDRIALPDGFRISVFADQLPEARSMALSAEGTLFVGNREGDRVYALRDENEDGRADSVYTVDTGLNTPNGVASGTARSTWPRFPASSATTTLTRSWPIRPSPRS